jgi:aminoglycoside phosphotransferase (APT) family kinase protein
MDGANGKLQEDAERIVSELFGRKIRLAQAIRRGVMTFKYLVETADQERFIVRFYPQGRQAVVNYEPDLLARCHRAGMLVPLVIADARTGPKAALAYVAYRMTEGTALSEALPQLSAAQRTTLAAELTRCLFDLRRVEFHGYGELLTGDAAADSSWRVFVNRSFDAGMESLAQHRLVDSATLCRLLGLVERARHIEDWRPCQLVWGDIGFGNILVNSSGRLAGLIDFESCLSGDPLATLGYCFSAHGHDPLCAALLDAWPETLDSVARERILFYAILRALRLARYADRPLPTGHPRDPLLQVFPGVKLALDTLTDRPHKDRT